MERLAFEESWTAVTIYRPNGCEDCALIRRPSRQSPRFYPHISIATRNRLYYLCACAGNWVMPLPFPLPEGQLSYYWLRHGRSDLVSLEEQDAIENQPALPIRVGSTGSAPLRLLLSWMKAFSSRMYTLFF